MQEAAVAEASSLVALSSFTKDDAASACLMHQLGVSLTGAWMMLIIMIGKIDSGLYTSLIFHSADDVSVQSIGKLPPAVVIMNTRPHFAPVSAILELCEALALAATYFVGMQAWATAEALLVCRSARRFDDISECCFGSNSDKHEL